MDEAIKYSAIPDQENESSVESEVLPEGASSSASENVGTMDEDLAADSIHDQHNQESSEAEVILEGTSG